MTTERRYKDLIDDLVSESKSLDRFRLKPGVSSDVFTSPFPFPRPVKIPQPPPQKEPFAGPFEEWQGGGAIRPYKEPEDWRARWQRTQEQFWQTPSISISKNPYMPKISPGQLIKEFVRPPAETFAMTVLPGGPIRKAGRIAKVVKAAGKAGKAGKAPPPVATGDPLFDEALDIIKTKVLPAQKTARKATEQLFKETRAPKFEKVEEIFQTGKGEAMVKEAAGELTGRLPRAEFESIEKLLTQAHKDAIINNLAKNPNLPKSADRFRASMAMKRIFSPLKYLADHPKTAEAIPPNTPFQPGEMALFEKAWGKPMADDLARAAEKLMSKPIPIDPATKNYLLSLKGVPFGQARLGEKFVSPVSVTRAPSLFERSAEDIVQIVGSKEKAAQIVAKAAKEAGAESPLQQLIIELANHPQPMNPTPVEAIKRSQQFFLMPLTQREKVIETLRKIGVSAVDALGIPKALKFAFDASYLLRQGFIMGVRHPVAWGKAVPDYFKVLFSKPFQSREIAIKLNRELLADPSIARAVSHQGIDFYSVEAGASWYARPESLASRIAEKIPGVGRSNYGAAAFMNKLMADVAVKNERIMMKIGSSEGEYKAMGELINWMGGRGTLPKWLHGTAGDVLNKLLTSPRYVSSRFELPTKLFSSSKAVRQEAASTLVAWAGLVSTIVALVYANGARVEFDPRSSDAYKIRIGDKRLDLWVGYAQIIRFLAQMITGQRKTATGEIVPISRAQILGRFMESKEAPGIGALATLLSYKEGEVTTYTGEKLDLRTLEGWGNYTKETLSPAVIEELVDAYVLEGGSSAALSGLEFFGVGVSTYEQKSPLPTWRTPIEPFSGGGFTKKNKKLDWIKGLK